MGAVGGGEGPVGESVAQDGAQQRTSTESIQSEPNRAGYTKRRAHKAQSLEGGNKRDTDDLVGDTVAVNTDRNRLPAARKSVESERVAGSGGISRAVRRKLGVGGVPSVAAQGAAVECQGLVAGACGNHAATANKIRFESRRYRD